ncbi:unnamed protein product [Linum trigynum]|uniref:Uncharacterized protein n=1 Tax=Linum trigynum TaxID=586398 RepID=A0AAV2G734_9ROSI
MVDIGRETSSDLEQHTSKPLEKNRPWDEVKRIEPLVAWDLAWRRDERTVVIMTELRWWSPLLPDRTMTDSWCRRCNCWEE